jgi:hypothetical protein
VQSLFFKCSNDNPVYRTLVLRPRCDPKKVGVNQKAINQK